MKRDEKHSFNSRFTTETLVLITDGNSETLVLILDSNSETLVLIIDGNSETLVLIIDGNSETLVLILDGNSEIGVHVSSNLFYLIISRAVKNRIFFSEKTYFISMIAQPVLSYHLL